MKFPAPTSDLDRKLLADIESHGWHVIRVPSDDDSTGWAFSVGLFHTFRHPEVVIFGLSTELMHDVLNGIGEDVRAGHRYEADVESHDVLEGVHCMFKAVRPRWYPAFMGYGVWLYRGDRFPVMQCVWPDKSQRYPWDDGFRRDWLELQPLLFHEDAEKASVGRWLKSMGIETE